MQKIKWRIKRKGHKNFKKWEPKEQIDDMGPK